MGIYQESYRRFEGKLQGRLSRVYTILHNEFMWKLKNKWILVILILAWGIDVLFTLMSGNFMMFFILSFIWLLLFPSIVGGPILAEDFRHNAISLYLSRPLNKLDYFLGKYFTLFFLIALISILPNIIISVFIVGSFYGTSTDAFDYYRFAFALIGIGILMAFVFTNIGLAFSAMTNNHKYASGGIFAFLFFSNVLSLALSNLYDKIMYCSIWANFMLIFSSWVDESGENSFVGLDANIGLAILMIISFICILIVYLRIHRAELSE